MVRRRSNPLRDQEPATTKAHDERQTRRRATLHKTESNNGQPDTLTTAAQATGTTHPLRGKLADTRNTRFRPAAPTRADRLFATSPATSGGERTSPAPRRRSAGRRVGLGRRRLSTERVNPIGIYAVGLTLSLMVVLQMVFVWMPVVRGSETVAAGGLRVEGPTNTPGVR
jgi:hypothetical protein